VRAAGLGATLVLFKATIQIPFKYVICNILHIYSLDVKPQTWPVKPKMKSPHTGPDQ
jgi:hypothetical protein